MNVQTVDVAAYAEAVRRALADLGPDQVDDLTDGLEADLAEAMADDRHAGHGTTLDEQFGPAERYAAELRAAAGIEAPSDAPRSRRPHPVRRTRELVAAGTRRLDAMPWWPPVRDFLVSLRSAWWLLRAWVIFQVVAALLDGSGRWLPSTVRGWAVLVVLGVLSVQWGRGRLQPPGRWNAVPLAVSAVAVMVALPTLGWVLDHSVRYVSIEVQATPMLPDGGPVPSNGVIVDGMAVSNLFVYDALGNPVPSAQIYDDRGRPVRTTVDEGTADYMYTGMTEAWHLVGTQVEGGRTLWNVYPLQGGPHSDFRESDMGLTPAPGAVLGTPPWPFAKAPAISTAPVAAPLPSAAPAAQASAAAAAAAAPSGSSPSPTASSGAPTPAP